MNESEDGPIANCKQLSLKFLTTSEVITKQEQKLNPNVQITYKDNIILTKNKNNSNFPKVNPVIVIPVQSDLKIPHS